VRRTNKPFNSRVLSEFMNEQNENYIHLIDQLVQSTVRLVCEDENGRQSCGTGYIYTFEDADAKRLPCVITNKHVVKGASRGTFNLTIKNEDKSVPTVTHEPVTLFNLQQHCIMHPSPNIDLVAIPIGPILNSASRSGKDYQYIPIDKSVVADAALLESLTTMEDIVMIGYPNGIWDEKHNRPIIRKGITATHAKLRLNDKPEFLIDAACFPGSSGSPVFLFNAGGYASADGWTIGERLALLGTLYAGPQHNTEGEVVVVQVPTDTKVLSRGSIPSNLGYVIHASELIEFEATILARVQHFRALIRNRGNSRNAVCACGSGKRHKECCGRLASG
jgi:hypothetical protein